MRFTRMDALFHMASHGDKEAYSSLYNEIVRKANTIIKSVARNQLNFSVNPGDFLEIIDETFFDLINEYDSGKGPFSAFVEYLLSIRFVGKIKRQMLRIQCTYIDSYETEREEGLDMELFADPNQLDMISDIAINNFELRISSPQNKGKYKDRMVNRVLLLLYSGFKIDEICETLKITRGEYRGIIKYMNSKSSIKNLRLDLK